jgi:hypothetical protein
MFRATSCSSSGESVVSIQHLVCVTVCRWSSSCRSVRNFPTCILDGQSDIYQMLYWYNWFSWWWSRSCSKHVENWNKHIEKEIVHQVGHLQELARYWFRAPWGWHDSVKTCSNVIICEIIVHLLVILQNNKICTVDVLKCWLKLCVKLQLYGDWTKTRAAK